MEERNPPKQRCFGPMEGKCYTLLRLSTLDFHKLCQWQHLKFLEDEAPSSKSYFDSLVVNGVLLLIL